MCKTMLVVVLYDKTYKDSLTLNCLMNKEYTETDLLIINVGPKSLEFDKEFIHTLGFFVNNITINEFLDDRPLSSVCNSVINEHRDYERFVFFDDESILKKNHLKKLDLHYTDDVDLQIPNIRSRADGKVHYPIINEAVRRINDGVKITPGNMLLTIGSGLVIYRSLVDKFTAVGMEVFDGRFTLGGVDYSFFIRLEFLKMEKLDVTIQIVSTVEHSLYRTDFPSRKWRVMERLRESILSMKTYFTHNQFIM